MNGVYSKFYTGNENPFGIGTWDSNLNRKLKKSSSQPYFLTNNSTQKNNLVLPPINSKHENGTRKIRQFTTKSSNSSSSYQYDLNKNRKELSNYIKDINFSVANKLQNDNFIAQQKLNNLKNNYNEIKTLLNNKLEKLEQDQQMQFDNLKLALGQGGGLKMLGAVKNANGGNLYDLQRAEQEDIIDATRKLPKLLDKKINEALNYKRYNKYKNNYEDDLTNMKQRMDEELKRQKYLDDMKFKRELDEIEAKRETMRQERERMLQELQDQDIDDLNDPLYLPPPPSPFPFNPYNPYNPYMMPPPYFMPPMNNNSNNNQSDTSELIKFFLIKKLFDSENRPSSSQQQQNPLYPYGYNNNPYMPYQPFGFPNPNPYPNPRRNSGRVYPQPIILPYPGLYNPNQMQNGMQQQNKNKNSDTESQHGVPFVDPLEKYLEMVNAAHATSKQSENDSNAKPIKLKKKEGDEEENEDGDGDGEDNEDGDGEGDGDGEDEGDGGNEDEGDGEDDDGGDEED